MPALRLPQRAVFALGIDEMPDELIDRIVQALSHAEPLDDHPTDED
ncbi:hypothetical protein QA641_39425 [Bradyrhizobium sp. CB1650]|nr:hypothetical protein [Bradyrhizobium sp. CB1650]WGD51456.1 hypothetical protein QA641_39425 [Bradyrhizobium sp. CB1650]